MLHPGQSPAHPHNQLGNSRYQDELYFLRSELDLTLHGVLIQITAALIFMPIIFAVCGRMRRPIINILCCRHGTRFEVPIPYSKNNMISY
jgi:hypothetical protein